MQLTAEEIYEVLCLTLPAQNDFFVSDYYEELNELYEFGILTKDQLLDLVNKHRERVLAIDSEPLDEFHINQYRSEYGDKFVEERIVNGYWFAFPALLRVILELEFGSSYIEFSKRRDNN